MTVESLQELLREARNYVLGFYPADHEQELAREDMLQRIDLAAPPPPPPEFVVCDKDPLCCNAKGHEGECDDLPF